ncbi:hypothetical protein KL86DYS1_31714 [uncultured Dysgonomonas sp.]|uniref:Uncharacterized protein n=1 Tax=uncultured Dysgonomonas sp. TaxID=206096 RepID=A0A212K7M4_9BACT|nr:hypothetical protein KL86DYS1_31714 [uncultured Dysgonomonas sp.]
MGVATTTYVYHWEEKSLLNVMKTLMSWSQFPNRLQTIICNQYAPRPI